MAIHAEDTPSTVTAVVEWRAAIRGRQVRCRWVDGTFEGDREVLERLHHVAGGEPDAETLDEARRLIDLSLLDAREVLLFP